MSKSKSHGKDKTKSAQLVLRVERSERDAFIALCDATDTTAAREIRRFMRDYVARNTPAPVAPEPAMAESAAADAVQASESAGAVEAKRAEAKPAAAKGRKKAASAS